MLSDDDVNHSYKLVAERLNPCSNGICSLTYKLKIMHYNTLCLNPCSNGICSLTEIKKNWNNKFHMS